MADPSAPSLRDRIIDLAIVWDEQSIEPAEDFADAVLAVLADADPTDLGLVPIEGVAYCPVHDEMDIEGYDPMGRCRRSDGCAEVPVYARPRPAEMHTVDVGHVHVLTTPGGPCAPTCPHPDHCTKETPDA